MYFNAHFFHFKSFLKWLKSASKSYGCGDPPTSPSHPPGRTILHLFSAPALAPDPYSCNHSTIISIKLAQCPVKTSLKIRSIQGFSYLYEDWIYSCCQNNCLFLINLNLPMTCQEQMKISVIAVSLLDDLIFH